RDPDARAKRCDRIATRREYALPEREPVLQRQLAREIPPLGECPQHEIEQWPENDERDQREHERAQQVWADAREQTGGCAPLPCAARKGVGRCHPFTSTRCTAWRR